MPVSPATLTRMNTECEQSFVLLTHLQCIYVYIKYAYVDIHMYVDPRLYMY